MTALVDHLEQQSTQNRLASYFNIDTLKYRVRHCSVIINLLAHSYSRQELAAIATSVFTMRCTIVQSVVLRPHVVSLFICLFICLSICDVGGLDNGHVGWKSWKLIARTISPTSSLFIAQRSSTYSQGMMEKFWGENVRSTPTSITSGWIESTESHVILGGDVAACLLLSVHRAVIFAIAQLSCLFNHPKVAADGGLVWW